MPDEEKQIRIQFTISESEWQRAAPHIINHAHKSDWAKEAFIERVNRMEARDERAKRDRLRQDMALLRPAVEAILQERGYGNH